jgi:hypothetical protein
MSHRFCGSLLAGMRWNWLVLLQKYITMHGPMRYEIFLFLKTRRPLLGPTKPNIQLELRALSPGRNLVSEAEFHVLSGLQSVELYLFSVPTPPCRAHSQINFSKINTIRQLLTKSSTHLAMSLIRICRVRSPRTLQLTVSALRVSTVLTSTGRSSSYHSSLRA